MMHRGIALKAGPMGAAARGKVHGSEFSADRDHAMCNVQNRTIPVVQRMSIKTFWGTGVLNNVQCFGPEGEPRQWRSLAERVSFTGSCQTCLILSPLPCQTLPK
jgi:hypothetical protein